MPITCRPDVSPEEISVVAEAMNTAIGRVLIQQAAENAAYHALIALRQASRTCDPRSAATGKAAMTDIDELERMARALISAEQRSPVYPSSALDAARSAFDAAARPEVIIELIAEVRASRSAQHVVEAADAWDLACSRGASELAQAGNELIDAIRRHRQAAGRDTFTGRANTTGQPEPERSCGSCGTMCWPKTGQACFQMPGGFGLWTPKAQPCAMCGGSGRIEAPSLFEPGTLPCPDCPRKNAALRPDTDGWIPWAGGTLPVGRDTTVEVRLRSDPPLSVWSGRLRWEHCGAADDIIAYRVITPSSNRTCDNCGNTRCCIDPIGQARKLPCVEWRAMATSNEVAP